jgi:AraC family transcriptional regulator of adaptative response / DNA-3-methyladenine glycosylase II
MGRVGAMHEDFERCYRASLAKDSRFDGVFFAGVTSTGIYCRPSCPAITPKRANIRFYPTAAAAQAAGFRACKRCRPDASPGSPEWNIREDLAARAMQLIADGVVDRDGVGGLARRLHLGERHLHRQLAAELGAGPQALARAHRAQTARTLIETTRINFSEIAYAAGFSSIRQFNDTIRQVFASTPRELRMKRNSQDAAVPGAISLRLPMRLPFFGRGLFEFLGSRAVKGIEEFDDMIYRRTLRLPRSSGTVELEDRTDHVSCVLRLEDLRDLTAAVQRCRRLLDLDADPVAIDEQLRKDRLLARSVKRTPGRRVPGAVDGFELAVRGVVGQQISVAGARTLLGRIVGEFGKPLTAPDGELTHVFPEPETLAETDLSGVSLTGAKQRSVRALAAAVASGDLSIGPGEDRAEVSSRLLRLPGVGPWTANYISMRALADPDAFLATDLGVRRALERLDQTGNPEVIAERWRPWRSYALQHLWATP